MMRPAGLIAAAILLGSCATSFAAPRQGIAAQGLAAQGLTAQPRPVVGTPAPRRAPTAAPRPVLSAQSPAPVGTMIAWADAPLSPGGWRYRREPGGQSRAQYGLAMGPVFQFVCGPGRSVAAIRAGAGAGALTLRTTTAARTLQAVPTSMGLTAQMSANDPLLDAMAFSRGRIAVEAPGTAPLILPAWPELARVIEDCRR